MIKIVYTIALAAAAAATTPAWATTTIANYSFEDPDLHGGGFRDAPNATGSFFFNAGVTAADGNFSAPVATNGSQSGYLTSSVSRPGIISLDVAGLTIGSSYNFIFDSAISGYYNFGGPGVTVSFQNAMFPSVTLGTFSSQTVSYATSETMNFRALASVGTLTFAAARSGYTVTFIDNIRIAEATAAAAVPEPATWTMMLAGFGLIGLAARRRSSVRTAVTYA